MNGVRNAGFLAIGIVAPLVLAACGTASRNSALEVNDTGVLPALRLSIAPSTSAPPSEPRAGFAFELGVSNASGTSTQNLSGIEAASIEASRVAGPAQLKNDADARLIDALARLRFGASAEAPLGLELLIGLSQTDFEFTAGPLHNSQQATQLAYGIGGLLRLRNTSMLHARYTSAVSAELDTERFELAWVEAFGRHFAARAGYGTWNVVRTPPAPGSEIRMRVSGPMLGVDLSF